MLSPLHFTSPLNNQTLYYSSTPLLLHSNNRRKIITYNSLASTPNTPRRFPSLSVPVAPICALPAESAAAGVSTATEEKEAQQGAPLPPSLRPEALPRHVAVIMDGNSRWARARGLPSSAGHEAGYRRLKKIVDLSCQWGIRALTVFAFSSENWSRPKAEIDFLMMLFENVLKESMGDFLKVGIRVCLIGDSSELPKSLQKLSKEVVDATKNNTKLDLIVAISYSGRREITQACRNIAQKVKHGLLQPEDITESHIAEELGTNCILESPYPDLLIRTSGELRLSNFLLWQSAYTELFFTDTYWPDFNEDDYIEALCCFQNRQRRFGQRLP